MLGSIRSTRNFIFLICLLLILFSYAMFQGGFVSWFLFYSFLTIFLYHLGLLLYPINNWQITRVLSHQVIHAGDHITVTIEIKRTIPFPIYYCIVEEIFPHTLKKTDHRYEKVAKPPINRQQKTILFPWFRLVMELQYDLRQIPRGEHQFGVVRIKTGDVFGFIKKEHTFQVANQLVAYPKERQIQMKERVSSFAEGSAPSTALNLKQSNITSGIREYVPGDKFSWIDWKQTARKNTIMTKEFEQEKSTDTMFVLDACQHAGVNPLAFEGAIEVLLSLMGAVQKQASQFGLLSIGEEVVQFPLQFNPTKKEMIRQHLTRVQPTGKQSFAIRLKEEILKKGNRFVMMIVVTKLDDQFKQAVQEMKKRTKQIFIFFIQSEIRLSTDEKEIVQQLQNNGVVIHVLNERQLMKNPIEVNT